MTEDEQHLRWLSIAHYVLGALYGLFNLLIFVFIGLMVWMPAYTRAVPRRGSPELPPQMFMGIMATFLAFTLLWSLALVACIFLTGRYLAKRKHYVFCFVVAALNCMWFPVGTVVGVFTIIVLSRPSVKAVFSPGPASSVAGGTG
jgi:hypothetical protein